jgi:hypothetical protein
MSELFDDPLVSILRRMEEGKISPTRAVTSGRMWDTGAKMKIGLCLESDNARDEHI